MNDQHEGDQHDGEGAMPISAPKTTSGIQHLYECWGSFLRSWAAPCSLATLWELDSPRAAIVNAVSGLVLLSVAVGMLLISRRYGTR